MTVCKIVRQDIEYARSAPIRRICAYSHANGKLFAAFKRKAFHRAVEDIRVFLDDVYRVYAEIFICGGAFRGGDAVAFELDKHLPHCVLPSEFGADGYRFFF